MGQFGTTSGVMERVRARPPRQTALCARRPPRGNSGTNPQGWGRWAEGPAGLAWAEPTGDRGQVASGKEDEDARPECDDQPARLLDFTVPLLDFLAGTIQAGKQRPSSDTHES